MKMTHRIERKFIVGRCYQLGMIPNMSIWGYHVLDSDFVKIDSNYIDLKQHVNSGRNGKIGYKPDQMVIYQGPYK